MKEKKLPMSRVHKIVLICVSVFSLVLLILTLMERAGLRLMNTTLILNGGGLLIVALIVWGLATLVMKIRKIGLKIAAGALVFVLVFTGMAIGYLSEALAPRQTCHGVLLDVFGVCVLITGESGVGKSECALELIKRGHLLVADDVVDIARVGRKLRGESPEVVRDLMELRGIGIVDIKSIFGIGATMRRKSIDIIIHLEAWSPEKDYDRLGTHDRQMDILGISVPLIEIPVRPGRNLAIIVEIAARNWRLRSEGYDAVNELERRLARMYGCQDGDEKR